MTPWQAPGIRRLPAYIARLLTKRERPATFGLAVLWTPGQSADAILDRGGNILDTVAQHVPVDYRAVERPFASARIAY